jgi:hypothetical protein
LRSPELRQLDQRVSIRYELEPLDRETVAAYVAHRLMIAGGSAAVTFAPKALRLVHRWSGGIPRLINLICDRALFAAYSVRSSRITSEMVTHAAGSLDVQLPAPRRPTWLRSRASLMAAASVVLLASALAVGATAYLYRRFATNAIVAERAASRGSGPAAVSSAVVARQLPANAELTILVGSYAATGATTLDDIRELTRWLEDSGFAVFYADVDLGTRGRWQRVLAGAYTDAEVASRDVERLKTAAPTSDPRLVSAGVATGLVSAVSRALDPVVNKSGT